jgi:hypothetical protein
MLRNRLSLLQLVDLVADVACGLAKMPAGTVAYDITCERWGASGED